MSKGKLSLSEIVSDPMVGFYVFDRSKRGMEIFYYFNFH